MRTGTMRWLAEAILVSALGLGAPSLWAQDTEVPERGLQVTGSYRLGEIETINTKNGNVMLSVPLGSLPPGRAGEPGFALALNYNSKLWDLWVKNVPLGGTVTPQPPPGPGQQGPPPPPRRTQYQIHRELRKNFANPGWHYNYDYLLRVEDRSWHHPELNNLPTEPTPNYEVEDRKSWYRYKVWMVLPDGSARLFRPVGESDLAGCSLGCDDDYFRILPTGWKRKDDYTNGWERPVGSTVSYYSVDGSYLRLDFEADGSSATEADAENWQDNRWVLYYPDGRQVRGEGKNADSLVDRNGNVTTIARVDKYAYQGSEYPAVEIIDAVGRTVTVVHGAGANGATVVIQTGVEDKEDLIWTVAWTDLKACRDYYKEVREPPTVTGTDTASIQTGLSAERLRMVDWVEPPEQLGGSSSRRFNFGYNATASGTLCGDGSTGGLGEMSSVEVPSGASAAYEYKEDDTGVVASADYVLWNSITSKEVTYGGTTERWGYTLSRLVSAVVEAPDGGKTRESYDLDGNVDTVSRLKVVSGTETVQEVTERVWAYNIPSGDQSTSTLVANPYVKAEYRTLASPGGTLTRTAVRTFAYDQNGNLTEADEYDWVNYSQVPRVNGKPTGAAVGTRKRRTVHTYYKDGTGDAYEKASSPAMLTARKSTAILDGSGTARSRREFDYDDAGTTGNLEEERIWDSRKGSVSDPLTSSNAITITHDYDGKGNRTETIDGRGNKTEWTYGTVAVIGGGDDPQPLSDSEGGSGGRGGGGADHHLRLRLLDGRGDLDDRRRQQGNGSHRAGRRGSAHRGQGGLWEE